jgi:hypothetical protein
MKLKTVSISIPLFLVLWLVLLRLPDAAPSPNLDASWASALSYFADQHMQFGKDVIFTYGPLGYLYSPYYSGHLIKNRIILELVAKAVIVILLLVVTQCAGKILGFLFLLNIFLFWPARLLESSRSFSPFLTDALFLFTTTFLLVLAAQHEDQPLLSLGVSVSLAFLSLVKFLLLVTSIVGLLPIGVYWAWQRKWFQAGLIVATYVFALLLFWLISGQALSGIIQYLYASMQISTGYAKAMYIEGANPILLVGAGTLIITATVILELCIYPTVDGKSLLIGLLLAEGLFFSWKHGFIRADTGHIIIFFSFIQLTLGAAWALARFRVAHKRTFLILTFIGILLSYIGVFPKGAHHYHKLILSNTWYRIENNVVALTDIGRYVDSLQHKLSLAKAQYALPTIKNIVEHERVDVFGFEQGIALLNEVNYRPRPVFQSYSAYTPFLLNVNQAFYLSSSAPRFVLFKLQTIDGRIPAADDSMALDALLYNYSPVIAEKGYLLWKQRIERQSLPLRQLFRAGEAIFYEKIDLPGDQPLIWAQIEWETPLLGKLRELLHKPAEVSIEITSDTGKTNSFRLVEPLARAGFIVSPLFHDTADVIDFVTEMRGNRPLSFKLTGSRRYYSRFRYKLYRASDFPRQSLSQRVGNN